ncbi:MAG TPA: hypothetical protein VJH33_01285 [Candidatus Paceibacterota bacterium]
MSSLPAGRQGFSVPAQKLTIIKFGLYCIKIRTEPVDVGEKGMRTLANLGSGFLNAMTGILFLIVFFTPIGAKATEDKMATSYVRALANGALDNAQPTAKRVAYWTKMIEENLYLEHIAALGATAGGRQWKNLSAENREILKKWLFDMATDPQEKFMQLISNSLIVSVEVSPCEIVTPVTCNSRVALQRFSEKDIKLTVIVALVHLEFKVDDIIYQDTIHVRDGMAKALGEALRKGEIALK